jgi:hypothetical protein
VSLTASDEEHIRSQKNFLVMPNRMKICFIRTRSKLIVVELHEEEFGDRTVKRLKGVLHPNHLKRW